MIFLVLLNVIECFFSERQGKGIVASIHLQHSLYTESLDAHVPRVKTVFSKDHYHDNRCRCSMAA